MNHVHCNLSLAALLFTVAPLCTTEPPAAGATSGASSAAEAAQDLERKAREVLGDAVEKKAGEVAARLRGGQAGTADEPGDGDDDEGEGEGEEEADDEAGIAGAADPLLAHLTAIEERLCAIEGLLTELTARSAQVSVPAAAPIVPPAAPAIATVGSAVTAGFEKARVRIWNEGKEVTVKLSVNGIPAGRFDTATTFDLGPFLQPGRMNQLAFTIDPRGKSDASGVTLHVEAQMPGAHDYVAILQFQATKERLADTFEIPWGPR